MLRFLRLCWAVLTLAVLTLLLVDFTGSVAPWGAPLARLQVFPAVLRGSVVALVILVAMVMLLGRVYCSVLCPLGVYQDVVSRVRWWLTPRSRRRRRERFPQGYRPPATALRMVILGLTVALVVYGFTMVGSMWVAGLLDPYSAFGRIAATMAAPLWDASNNLLAARAADSYSYAFYPVSRAVGWVPLTLAVVTCAVVTVMAWRTGRGYCNTVCPVGTLLGLLSRHSLLKPVIDVDQCVDCGACERACKSHCIDSANHAVDLSRCVVCLDCVEACRRHAISYSVGPSDRAADAREGEPADAGRRAFLATGVLLGGTAVGAVAAAAPGLGAVAAGSIRRKADPVRRVRLLPPGAVSQEHFDDACTGCQLCIQTCPQSLLVAETSSVAHLLQPRVTYARGYCRPECNLCSTVCPTGAILPLTVAEKASTVIGRAVVDLQTCLSASQGVDCHGCEQACPAAAILLVPAEGAQEPPVSADPADPADTASADGSHPRRHRPVVDLTRCIGCGACEFYCPVGRNTSHPQAAIHVEGILVQHPLQ